MTLHNITKVAGSFLYQISLVPSFTMSDLREFAPILVCERPSEVKYYSVHATEWFEVGCDMKPQKDEQAILQGILDRHDQAAYKSCRALLNATYWASVAGKAYQWGNILSEEGVDLPKDVFAGYRNSLLVLFACSLYAAERYYKDVDIQYNYLMGSREGMWRLDWYTRNEGLANVQMYMSTKDSWKTKQREMLRAAIAHFFIEQNKEAQNG